MLQPRNTNANADNAIPLTIEQVWQQLSVHPTVEAIARPFVRLVSGDVLRIGGPRLRPIVRQARAMGSAELIGADLDAAIHRAIVWEPPPEPPKLRPKNRTAARTDDDGYADRIAQINRTTPRV